MSQTTTAARPYARAAFDLARQTERVEAWAEFLARLDALSEMAEVQKLIAQPGVDKTRLASVLAEAAQADDSSAQNFIRLLAENRRLALLPAIRSTFDALRREAEDVVDVTITTAATVEDAQRDALRSAIEKHFGRKTELHWAVDEALIAGARLRAGDHVIDASAAGALEQLRDAVTV